MTIAAALAGGALHRVVLPMAAPGAWSLDAALVYKIGYALVLALLLVPPIVHRALTDTVSPPGAALAKLP